MIQFNLSSELQSVLGIDENAMLKQETADESPSMIWFAHTIEVKGIRCIITIEQQTRYAMVFCDLCEEDMAGFKGIFQDRLWREVFAICQEGNEQIIQHLSQHIISLCETQSFYSDYDRCVHGLIRLIAADLESRVYDSDLDLPIDSGDAFEFGVEINNALRNVPDRELQYFTPIESFKRLCLGLLNDVVPMSLFSQSSISAITRYLGEGCIDAEPFADELMVDEPSNVIEVDFFTRKKKLQLAGASKRTD